ncbi:DUF2889 domain-containing protein [uncultured Neptuniibacter sp.]|uniref:DUF2889 domain-containing protein n=1 Tax=uncultured Neptuniibacter sp. TaxID=502143 RepID=UPI00262FD704|nr:DUF2889 domain-containing protein [uncultured Neptuniibacter sp.]
MPLSKPVKRMLHHQRVVRCHGYLREDGDWDIEARMTDTKSHNVDNPERGGYVPAGEPFHDLSIRLTMDNTLLIREVEASIDYAPFKICSGIISAFKKLEGSRIGPGWQLLCRDRLGGVQGCTHLNELLPVLATTAIQTLWPNSDKDVLSEGARLMLNSCHSWSQSGSMVKRYLPNHYQPENLITVSGA